MYKKLVGALLVMVGLIVAVSLTLTGSGTIGPVLPGWSVSEECTPVAPGDTSGSVGSVSLDAAATASSVFALDNDAWLIDDDAGGFRGNVIASPVTGRKVHLDVAGKLNFLVANRTVDPIWFDAGTPLLFGELGSGTGQFGSVVSTAVDTFDNSIFVMSYSNVSGVDRYKVIKFSSSGAYITEFGSFGSGNGQFGGASGLVVDPSDGSVFVGDSANSRVQKFTTSGGRTTYTYSTKVGAVGSGNGQFGSTATIYLTRDSSGNIYATDRGNARFQKFTSSLVFSAASTPLVGYEAAPYSITYDGTDIYISAVISSAVAATPANGVLLRYNTSLALQDTINIAGLQATRGGIFSIAAYGTGNIYASWGLGTFVVNYTVSGGSATENFRWYSGYPIPTDNNTNYYISADSNGRIVVLFRSSEVAPFSAYGQYRVTSFDWNPVPLSDAIEQYMRECDSTLGGLSYSYEASTDPNVIFPAWSGDVWAKLKEICTAYAVEIYPDDDTIRVADVGSRTLELKNHSPLKVTPTNLFGGQQIIIVAQNPVAGGGTVFDAGTTNTRFQIDVGQSNTVTVNTPNYPVTVDPLVPTDTLPILPGQYYVLDSTANHVPAATWLAGGGNVTPALGSSPGQIRFTLVGPTYAISGYTGPFTFADSLTTTGKAALILTGAGTFTNPVPYTFETGANPTKTTQLVARTITSFAIATVEQIFDIAPAAIDDVSGATVTVTFTMPTADLLGFGLTAGSIFTAEDSKYRVTNITWGRLKSQLIATRHITLDDVDMVTSGLTVDQRDDIWLGYSIDDRSIKPLALSL